MKQLVKRVLPRKARDQLPIWSEFNQLAQKYNAINLCHGTPGLDPPSFLIDNLERACREGFNQYTLFQGHPLFREKLSEFFSPHFKQAKNGQTLNPHTEILVTNGASEALFCAIHHLVEKGDEVIMFEPYYTSYVSSVEFGGATIKTAPFFLKNGQWEYDFDALEKQINPKTKVLMITNPHNPTSKVFTYDELLRLTEIVEKHPQLVVVSDDVYYFLPYDNRKYQLFANIGDNYKRTITVFSAGKMMNCTGWKVGWAIGPADLIKHTCYVHEASVFNNNVPGQIAIAKSLEQTMKPYQGHQNYYEYVRNTFQQARDNAIDLLNQSTGIKFKPTKCESGYFMAVDISENAHLIPDKYKIPGNYETDPNTIVIQRQFQERVHLDYSFCRWMAIEKGISLMPLSSFCLEESKFKLENYIRLAICKPPQTFTDPNLIKRFQSL